MVDEPIFLSVDPQAPERLRVWSSGLVTYWTDELAPGEIEVWGRSNVRAGRGTSYDQMIAAIRVKYPD